jgi:hypothetical protein
MLAVDRRAGRNLEKEPCSKENSQTIDLKQLVETSRLFENSRRTKNEVIAGELL